MLNVVRLFLLTVLAGVGGLAAWSGQAAAEGALAIGITGDIAKDGYSIGIATNNGTEDGAKKAALDHCKTHGGEASQARCEIVLSFENLCVAEAEDPQPGTPGAGWSVGTDKPAAEKLAMTMCLATAGKSRMQYCKVVSSICDGKAQ
jgi:Domain of unknown function (DUF4189)